MAKGKNKPGRKMNRHHIRPRSRISGGDKDRNNVVELDAAFHRNWHQLFENMTVEEVYEFIDRVMVPGERWTNRRLAWLRAEVMSEDEEE